MLRRLMEPWAECVYATLRVAAGLMFSFHGMQKILGILTEKQPEVGSQVWIGGLIELVGGLLVAFGLFTTWAAFLASGTMLVAYAQFHWKFRFDENLFPVVNKGELALLYSGLFLYVCCRGSGRFSLDRLRAKGGAPAATPG